jgi:hypothetical protein
MAGMAGMAKEWGRFADGIAGLMTEWHNLGIAKWNHGKS